MNLDNQSAASIVVKSMDLKFLTTTSFGAQRPKFQFLLLPPNKVEQFPVVNDAASVATFQTRYLTSSESGATSSLVTPWFDEYRSKFFKSLGPSAFEQFEHPVACIVATSSQDINPVDSLQRLFDRRATNVQNGLARYVDQSALVFHYVLVHDDSGTISTTDAIKKYALMEKTWPGQTSLVTLNSHKEATENEDFQIWRNDDSAPSSPSPNGLDSGVGSNNAGMDEASASASSPSSSTSSSPAPPIQKAPSRKGFQNRKVLISTNDMDSCKRMIRTLVWNWIVPHMERTLQSIFPEVSKERSGLMHKISLMWGSKLSRKNDESDPDGMLFEANTLEFRERRLADWAFMLGEFNIAHRTYLSLAEIYKNEAPTAPIALVYRASALEMAANSMCLLASNNPSLATPQQWNDIDKYFSEAWDLYQRGRRRTWARRSALAHAYWAQWRLQASASTAWERLVADSSDPLELALLNQQRALSYLLRRPARLRNFAFELVKAADAFTTGHQFLHAISCYFSAQQVYANKHWGAVNDYLHFRIARLANIVHRPDLAMRYISALLTDNNQSAQTQNSNLREYLHIFRTHGAHLPADLSAARCLPSSVSSSSSASDANFAALSSLPVAPVPTLYRKVKLHVLDVAGGSSQSTPEWQALESAVIEIMTPPDKRYLLTLKKPSAKLEHLGVVGEHVYVDVVLTNPLQVPLQFTDMRLACHLNPSYSAMASGITRRSSASKPLERNPAAPASSSSISQASSNSIPAASSAPVEEMWVAEKYDKLFGPGETRTVQFAVKPLVEGSLNILGVAFKMCGVLDAFRPLAKPPTIKVSVPMPRVSLSLLGLPGSHDSSRSSLYVGQHHEVCLRVKNLGQKPLVNLAFTTSHPHIFLSDAMEEDLSLPHKWAARIPLTAPLNPDQFIDVPIVLRPTAEGTQTLQMIVYYEPAHTGGPMGDLKHRLTRATFTLKVLKSLRCNATIHPDPLHIDRYLLALDLDNQTKLKTKNGVVIAVRNLRITSQTWRPILLDPNTGEPYADVSTKRVRLQGVPSSAPSGHSAPSGEDQGEPEGHISRSLTPIPLDQASESPYPASAPPSGSGFEGSPLRAASRTPGPNKLSLHSTLGASSYFDSVCMRPDAIETSFGSANIVPTILPPRHATTLLFRLERKSPKDGDFDVASASILFSHASTAATTEAHAAKFLSQESIMVRRDAVPKRSALFDSRTPEELEEARTIHEVNLKHNLGLFINWTVANDLDAAPASASLSALTLTLPSMTSSSSSKVSVSSGGKARGTNVIASANLFDIPFVPTSPWVATNAIQASSSSVSTSTASGASTATSGATGSATNNNNSAPNSLILSSQAAVEARILQSQIGLHYCAPIQVVLESESTVQHNFARGPAYLPVVFHVLNTSPFSALQLTFEALKPSEYSSLPKRAVSGASPSASAVPSAWKSAQQSTTKRRTTFPAEEGRSHYMWIGRTGHETPQLAPEGITSFALHVCFPLPGVYNLNRWRVWVAPASFPSRRVAVHATYQHFVVAENSLNVTETLSSSSLKNSSLQHSLMHSKFANLRDSLYAPSDLGATLMESHSSFLQCPTPDFLTPSTDASSSKLYPKNSFETSMESKNEIQDASGASVDPSSSSPASLATAGASISPSPFQESVESHPPTSEDLSAAVLHLADDSGPDLSASYAAPLASFANPLASNGDEEDVIAPHDSNTTLVEEPSLPNAEEVVHDLLYAPTLASEPANSLELEEDPNLAVEPEDQTLSAPTE